MRLGNLCNMLQRNPFTSPLSRCVTDALPEPCAMCLPVKYSHDLNDPLIFYSDCSLMPSNCWASPARGVATIHLFFQDAIFIFSGNTDSPSEPRLSRSCQNAEGSSGLKEKKPPNKRVKSNQESDEGFMPIKPKCVLSTASFNDDICDTGWEGHWAASSLGIIWIFHLKSITELLFPVLPLRLSANSL